MKKATGGLGFVVVLACAAAAFWYAANDRSFLPKDASANPTTEPVKKPEPSKFSHSTRIAPGKIQEWTFEAAAGRTPGRLFGNWNSFGSKNKGGNDDTLVSFQIRDPKNQVLQTLERPASGTFDLRVESPGVFIFLFDNGGLLRTTERVVRIDATYQPD